MLALNGRALLWQVARYEVLVKKEFQEASQNERIAHHGLITSDSVAGGGGDPNPIHVEKHRQGCSIPRASPSRTISKTGKSLELFTTGQNGTNQRWAKWGKRKDQKIPKGRFALDARPPSIPRVRPRLPSFNANGGQASSCGYGCGS